MTQKRKSLVLLLALLFTTLAFAIPVDSSTVQPTDLTGIKVAVYEGVTDGQSSSLSSRTALFWMFRWMNATVDVVTAAEIRNGVLDDYDIVAVPGGWAWAYFQDLDASGVAIIRQFVENGGAFFGVCAGAFFACDNIRWEGGYIQYSLDLYPNIGNGPIEEIAAWPGRNMTRINLNKGVDGPDLSGEPDSHTVMYYGGPYFETSGTEGVATLATYDINDEPAIISYQYEQGRIVLSGPHVEWEEDADRDGVAWVNVYDDEGSEWNMMLQIGIWLSEDTSVTSTTTSTTTPATTTNTTTVDPSPAPTPLEIDPVIGLVAIFAIVAVAVIADRLRK
ncbi:MAG: BPL-N domain-containing protein [Candidatus Thorarchaeota archaeon]|jgi:glutamine amidotransferase-like uncharacterized protein